VIWPLPNLLYGNRAVIGFINGISQFLDGSRQHLPKAVFVFYD